MRLSYVELDGLYHGPNWSVRPTFESEVVQFIAQDRWVLEWQYDRIRERLLRRADVLIWLDYPTIITMARVVGRTVRRSRAKEPLWNGNVEPPLWRVLVDRDHIVRWAWRTRSLLAPRMREALVVNPHLKVLSLERPSQVSQLLTAIASTQRRRA
jgi:adenylate kinase family enzyme